MNKFLLSLILVMISFGIINAMTHKDYKAGAGLYGGYWYLGASVHYDVQESLNASLTGKGYTALPDYSWGFLWGGGAFMDNWYWGGWGHHELMGPETSSVTANKTISRNSGIGGLEFGYAVIKTSAVQLVPSISMLWGANSLTFTTNIDFSTYVDNPIDYKAKLFLSDFSVSLGFNLFLTGAHGGVNLKAHYIYDLQTAWGPYNYSSSPVVNPHSFLLGLSLAFGKTYTWEEKKQMKQKMMGEMKKHYKDMMDMSGSQTNM